MNDGALVADTHAIVWYLSDSARLSPSAQRALDEAASHGSISISVITMIELVYLVEKGRLQEENYTALAALLDAGGSALRLVPVDRQVIDALRRIPRDDVPDMPDRIIAATALALGLPLVSRDARIRASPIRTIW